MIFVLLPGMDGTGTLFKPFLSALPGHMQAVTVSYPAHRPLNYRQLADRVLPELPEAEPFILVAESFSGPVALHVAAQAPPHLRAIVLVASFVAGPLGYWGRWVARLPWKALFRLRPPRRTLRWVLMEDSTPPEVVEAVQDAISSVRPEVLAARMREALTVDLTTLALACPVRTVCLMPERDHLLGRRGLRSFALLRSRLELTMVPGPHLLLQCAPQACMAAMAALGLPGPCDAGG